MSIDEAQLAQLRTGLEADDYHLEVDVADAAAQVTIVAGPNACEECLIPKPLMASMLAPVLGVDAEAIQLTYPVEILAKTE